MKLIIYDELKSVAYFGECKLQFNGPEKCLYLKLLDKDSEETMTASFKGIFICKNNFLCCLNQNLNNAMVFIFSAKEKCEQIFNAILKVKSRQSQTIENVAINEEEIFKESLFVPLITAVHGGVNGFQTMKKIILDFVNSLEPHERICYLNILAEILLVPTLLKSKTDVKDQIDFEQVSSTSEISTASQISNSSKYPARKRSFKNISYEEFYDVNEEGNKTLDKKSRRSWAKPSNISCFDEPSPKNSPCDVNFDIVQYIGDDGKMDKKLLVFTSNERKQCYEFLLDRGSHNYRCIKCFAKKKKIYIKSILHHDGSKTFDFNTENHICEPIIYLPENYQSSFIIHSPNFKFIKSQRNGKMIPYLIIFNSDDRSLCYKS